MATAYINKTIEIKNVVAQRGGVTLRADRSWVGEVQRQDLSGENPILDYWELTIKYNTKAEYDAIDAHLKSILYGNCYFWIDEFGGNANDNSIYTRVEPLAYERVGFNANGWNNNGRNFTIKFQEVPEVV